MHGRSFVEGHCSLFDSKFFLSFVLGLFSVSFPLSAITFHFLRDLHHRFVVA